MTVYANTALTPNILPGLAHSTLAGAEHGLRQLAVWSQSIDAGAGSPPHRHDCEEVILILEGSGALSIDGAELPFTQGQTLVIPPNKPHQIFNTGERALRLIAALSAAPVRVEFPDGTEIDLPWQTAGSARRD